MFENQPSELNIAATIDKQVRSIKNIPAGQGDTYLTKKDIKQFKHSLDIFSKQKFLTKFPQLCHSSRQRNYPGLGLRGPSSQTLDYNQIDGHILSRN